jgi:hypothetical protein
MTDTLQKGASLINLESLSEVSYRFTELGVAIEAVSAQNTRSFDDLLAGLRTLQMVSDSMSQDAIKGIASSLGANVVYAPQITQMYMNSFLKTDEVFKSLNSSMESFQKVFTQATTGASIGGATMAGVLPAGAGGSAGSGSGSKKTKMNLVQKEMKSLGGTIKGWAHKLKIPLPGALLAGGVMWAALGFKRTQRIAAEAGEIKNIFVGAVDATVKGMVDKGTEQVSKLQEYLQRSLGIAKSEVQAVEKAFVDGGVPIKKILQEVDASLGTVGESTLAFTLGLDKMFELPGGESAKRMVQMMADYGYTVEEAREKVTTLMLAGRESGIGTMQFVKNIQTAGDELKKFGFDMEAVSDLALTMQKYFSDMGVPEQFAGKQAARGLQQMAAGLAGMSEDWQMFFAERLGYGEGLAGRQKMLQSHTRVARKGGYEDLMKIYREYAVVAMEVNRGNEVDARYMLEKHMGLGFEGANTAIEIMKKLDAGELVKAKEIAKKHEKDMRDSLITEKEKRTSWELHMNEWMDAISIMGEGILAGFANLLAEAIVWGRSLITLIYNHFTGNDAANAALLDRIDKVTSGMSGGWSTFLTGLNRLAALAPEMGMDVLGPSIKAIQSAFDFLGIKGEDSYSPYIDTSLMADPWGAWQGTPPTAISPFASSAGTFSSPIVQTITIPAKQAGTYNVGPTSGEMPAAGYVPDAQKSWIEGTLAIVSTGVDAEGNIGLSLVGNCPQCGLKFGDAGFNYEEYAAHSGFGYVPQERRRRDLESMARMIASEVGTGRLKGGNASVMREAEGIAWTAVNRMKEGFKKGKAPTIEDVITQGAGYGKQGSKRPYSTAREATPESYEIAQKVLGGGSQDPTAGSTFFYHETAKGYGRGSSYAIPPFADRLVNKVNINNARFYGKGGDDAPDKAQRDAKLHERFSASRQKPDNYMSAQNINITSED